MMNKRSNLITLSAAVFGLAVCMTAPAALGHGNNPKRPDTSNTEPKDPGSPGGPDALSRPSASGGNAHLGQGPMFDGAGGGTGQLPSDVVVWEILLPGLPDIDPGSDVSNGISPADVLPPRRLGGPSAQGVPRTAPAGGVIPTPGTLGLLGVATLFLRRRRRR